MSAGDTVLLRPACRLTVKDQARGLIPFPDDFDVPKADPLGPPRAEGLEAGLLGGKTSGERENTVPTGVARSPFGLREDAPLEVVPMTTERRSHPGHLDHVDTQSQDQAASPAGPQAELARPGGILIVPRRPGLVSEIAYSQ